MIIPLKRETCTKRLSTTVPDSLHSEFETFKKQHGVSEAAALRFILSAYLSGDLGFSQVQQDNKFPQHNIAAQNSVEVMHGTQAQHE